MNCSCGQPATHYVRTDNPALNLRAPATASVLCPDCAAKEPEAQPITGPMVEIPVERLAAEFAAAYGRASRG